MKSFLCLSRRALLGIVATAVACAPTLSRGAPDNSLVTAVHSKVMNGYQRQKQPNGEFKPEYFAIANGGAAEGTERDPTIERVAFPELANVLGRHLAAQKYFLAHDANSADLLLVVYWGRTKPFADYNSSQIVGQIGSAIRARDTAAAARNAAVAAGDENTVAVEGALAAAAESELEQEMFKVQFFDTLRQRATEDNASLLGYIEEMHRVNDVRRWSAGGDYYLDLRDDIEQARYYLVVLAYDFRETVKRNNRKLLWGTRVSIRVQGNAFDRDFAAMLAKAAKHLGQDSGGLQRRYHPEGRVEIGEMEVLGMRPPANATDAKP